jgi:rhombotarget A family protien
MSWPRKSLLIALFAFSAPWASADTIKVNTKNDNVSNDDLCSLREAVEYFNRGKPANGYMGCKAPSPDELDTVVLPGGNQPYRITDGSIRVHSEITIAGEGRVDSGRTVVQVQGPSRAFFVYDEPIYRAPACDATAAGCAPAGSTGPYDDAPRLVEDPLQAATHAAHLPTDPPHEDEDYLTTVHAPTLFGTVDVPATTVVTPPAEDLPTSTRETTTETSYQVFVTLYDTPLGGERKEVASGFAESDGTWELTTDTLSDGQHSFVYTTRTDAVIKTTVITRDKAPIPAIISQSTSTVVDPGDDVSDESLASTVLIYTVPPRRSFTLKDLELVGCGLPAGCADAVGGTFTYANDADIGLVFDYVINPVDTAGKGGLIYSNERLLVGNVLLKDGVADTGGAVYVTTSGSAEISETELRDNTADNGAAVYGEYNSLTISRSLLTENVVSGAGAVVEVASSTRPSGSGLPTTRIENVTASGNDGVAFSLRNDMVINSSTIVLNSNGGVDFNNEAVEVTNTILAGNPATPPAVLPFSDCINDVAGTFSNNLVIINGGCTESGDGIQAIDNVADSEGQLLATDVGSGKCNSPFGIICPLADFGGATFSHKPRLLNSYDDLDDSMIVNKGSLSSTAAACAGADQRNEEREPLACDIGAVELQQVAAGETVRSGGSITYGETYEQLLGDKLRDEELLDIGSCPVVPPADPATVVSGSYRIDVPGCPWLEKSPSKGRVRFGAVGTDGFYYYTPSADFHGFDRFYIRVMTTTSKLNADPKDQSRRINATVIVEPPGGISSSSVGGAFDSLGILVLSLLGLRGFGRRRSRA